MDDACAVCAEPLEWVAYGACGHRDVCSTCVARLRFVLRDQRCCICMTPCPAVFVTKAMRDRTRVIDFSALPGAAAEGNAGEYWHHEGTQAWFDNADHYRLVRAMCRLSCSVCDSNGNKEERAGKASKAKGSKAKRKNKLRSVDQLKGHLLNRHCLYMCDLCLDGRKVFIREQKLYTMSQLNQHIKTGDSEVDGSEVERHGFRGHPMCEFCKSPFYGDNELYTHMTREHFSCHICQRQHSGQYDYFRNYDDLEMHFQRDHFLCGDKGCLEKKFIVFQSEQELKRHNAVEHGKHTPDAVNNSSPFVQNDITAVGHGLGSQAGSVAASLRSLRIGSVLQEASFPSLSEQSRKIPALRQSSRTAARIGDDPFPPLSGTSNRNAALQWQGLRVLTESSHATGLRQHGNGTEKMHPTVQHRSLENTGLVPSGSTTWPMHARSSAISGSLSEASFSRASAGNERQETLVNREMSSVEDVRAANKSLVEKMRAALGTDQDMYTAFKEISGEYRQGVIGAPEYLSDAKQFGLSHLVLEMARLLPDAQKQKELADAYYANLRLTSLQENGGGGTANSKQGNRDLKGKGKGEVADALVTTSAAKDSLEGKVLNTAIKLQSNCTPQEGCCGVQPLNGAWQSRGRQRLVSSNVKKRN